MGLHACREYATSWSLLPVAVRVAKGLGLPSNYTKLDSPVGQEVSRRVWFSIAVLDSKTSMDRGIAPLLGADELQSIPSIKDDSDVSFCWVTHQATICVKKLCDGSKSWETKLALLTEFDQTMKTYCTFLQLTNDPFAQFTAFATQDIALNMQLMARRPPYRCKQSSIPSWDDFDILKTTTEVLERSLQKSNESTFAPWAWFARAWVKWHALAVCLAELCTPRRDELADRAYAAAKHAFDHYASLVSRPDSGMLWKPVAKLYRRVQRLRGDAYRKSIILHQSPRHDLSPLDVLANPFTGNVNSTVDWIDDCAGLQNDQLNEFHLDENDPWLTWNLFLEDANEVDLFDDGYRSVQTSAIGF